MKSSEKLSAYLNEVFNLRDLRAKEAESEARANCKNGNASMATAIAALYAAWNTFHGRPPSEPVSTAAPRLSNLFVANHLSWLCNSALAIRTLALKGLEPQSKVLTRSFVESIYQTLVIFHDHDSYIRYSKGKDAQVSKEVYYEVFSKKQRLQNKLQKLEDEFKRLPDAKRSEQREQRIHMLEHYSQATHAAANHILTSSLQPNQGNHLEPTILGKFSIATENTLLNCSHEICYFAILFDHIVKNCWKVQHTEFDDHYQTFSELAKLTIMFRTHRVKSHENGNTSRDDT